MNIISGSPTSLSYDVLLCNSKKDCGLHENSRKLPKRHERRDGKTENCIELKTDVRVHNMYVVCRNILHVDWTKTVTARTGSLKPCFRTWKWLALAIYTGVHTIKNVIPFNGAKLANLMSFLKTDVRVHKIWTNEIQVNVRTRTLIFGSSRQYPRTQTPDEHKKTWTELVESQIKIVR